MSETSTSTTTEHENVFTYGSPNLKFGPGAADEIGFDLAQLGARPALVVTDAGVAATIWPQRVVEAMSAYGVEAQVYDGVHVEPTDVSLQEAVDAARESGPWDAFVAVGGGVEHRHGEGHQPADDEPRRADGLHQPAGRQGAGPHRAAPAAGRRADDHGHRVREHHHLRADVLALKVKTGISHARLRPSLAVVDPRLARTQPPLVTAASGMDILCHALES